MPGTQHRAYLFCMDFWSGIATFRYEGFRREVSVRAFLDLDLDLKVAVQNIWGFELFSLGQREDLTLEVPGVQEPIRLLMSHWSSSDEHAIFTPRRSPVWRVLSRPLSRGRAALINFGGFDHRVLGERHLKLDGSGWSLTMIPIGDRTVEYPPVLQSDEHAFTHHLEFSRVDGAQFSADEMVEYLVNLTEFFSFCHGGWIGVGLALGIDQNGEVAVDEWGTNRFGPQDGLSGCLDRYQISALQELHPLFMRRMEDDAWADTFGHVNYWLRRSSLENAGPDGGIILLQATLERFAWHLLVREQEALSERGFSDLTAADQLRLMLNALRLPKQVPDGLEELIAFAKANGLDAAEAFTRVRNRIVHPPKLKVKDEQLPFYDVYRLGRWYLELAA